MAPVFIPGLQLSEQFYQQAVLPLLHQAIPRLSHSAGLLDAGSEVFGFDTPRSTDHHWGPRVLIFLSDNDYQQYAKRLNDDLAQHLPYEFMGYSTHFSEPDDFGVQLLEPIHSGPVRHRVAITTVASFCRKWLAGYDPQTDASLHDWKRWPMQSLFAIRKGCLFHDDLHLESLRQRLWFYPRDVMLYLLSELWSRIEEEEAFVGRCGEMSDELGSHLIACRMVDALIKMTFLLEGEYYPYSKWLGTAFKQLSSSRALMPHFQGVMHAADWHEREHHLSAAYAEVIALQSQVDGLPAVEPQVSPFYTRPFLVPHAGNIVIRLREAIEDPSILST
ncbi:MAG: hypothetical protein ETSY1_28210 [Candidatus Entotheonella factor]|uniref:DUF4037 domain-containing protein n=1 Tax=Entotheonella factor TaxID=1429438 RepID=W4LDF2_ENTF1|nr:DUF4037 domain-containing protein [Candidatus Entotheonella palauensis]ETW96027.1 MAG: hypothetical protein ETSY1_28210 [Candidatus Entotheonella factor]